ncbi:MAG: hypothetical protein SVZ03_13075 [Spirochaetota bacterium]|nr:hypothetical protein [Spirochaetota bacterium]
MKGILTKKNTLVLLACALIIFVLQCKTTTIQNKNIGDTEKTEKVRKKIIDDDALGCIDGDCINGQGTFRYPDGSTYIGQFVNGLMEGQGTFTWGEKSVWAGSKFIGEFKKGRINGYGTWTWPRGGKYIGECKDNMIHGKGTMYYPDGRVKTGRWKNDRYVGE